MEMICSRMFGSKELATRRLIRKVMSKRFGYRHVIFAEREGSLHMAPDDWMRWGADDACVYNENDIMKTMGERRASVLIQRGLIE